MASAKGGSVLSRMGYGEGVPSQLTRGSWERHQLPQWGPRQSSDQKLILAYFEGHRMLLYDKI